MYVSILIISRPVVAANNRGETQGTVQTIQKVRTPNGARTVLSGVSLRYAGRLSMQDLGANMWRRVIEPTDMNPVGLVYGDNNSPTIQGAEPASPRGYDDGAFGFMCATKGSRDEDATKIVSAIEVTNGLSTTLYREDLAFCQGHKAAPDKNGKPNLAPYSYERHYTRYQYVWNINIPDARDKGFNFELFLESLKSLRVGGSHAGCATEISPEVIAYRFHKAPGCGGLYLGAGVNFSPDEPVNLEPLKAHCEDLGIDYTLAGAGTGTTIAQALRDILAEIQRVLA